MTGIPTRTGTRHSIPPGVLTDPIAADRLLAKLRRYSHDEFDPDGTRHTVWHGYLTKDGYPRVRVLGVGMMAAHRAAYELATRQALDPSLDLDHTCGRRACITVTHLEPVDRRTNHLRSVASQEALRRANARRAGGVS